MGQIIRTEKRKRGVLGWVFLLAFIAFNLLMLVAIVGGIGGNADLINNAGTDAEKAGAALGTALGASMLLFVWLAGAVILGLFVLMTRGKKIIIETTKE